MASRRAISGPRACRESSPPSGEGGIRTLERACAPYSLSRRVPSATRPPLRAPDCRRGTWRPLAAATPLHRAGATAPASDVGSPQCPPPSRPTAATSGSSPRSRRRSPSSTSTRCGPTPPTCWRRAGGKPIRVATKSVRCRALLERILARGEGFAGLLTFTLPETLWLAEQGFENLLLAYPTADRGALAELALRSRRQPRAGADRDGRLRRAPRDDRVGAGRGGGAGAGLHRRRRRLVGAGRAGQGRPEALAGPHGRAARSPWPARSSGRPQLELAALMAYEGQIAGVGDRPPGRRLRGAAIRFMQRRSAARAGGAARRRSSPRCARSPSSSSSTAAAPAASS